MDDSNEARWLLLIHQIPPKPNYFRVKIWRRLQRLGAVGVKNSVYVLPKTEQTQEDFQWVLREILEGGGQACLCEAQLIDGLSDAQVERMFQTARLADYEKIAEDARRLTESLPSHLEKGNEVRPQAESEFLRLQRRLAEVVAIDFFGAPGRESVHGLILGLEARLHETAATSRSRAEPSAHPENLKGRTWVTRKGIHVDRMASAWLIRRFIDAKASFKFVSEKGYQPERNELRFDMFEAEFTHEGDRCTFEVLMERLGLNDPALCPIAEIVHNVDLRDSKFSREETLGIDSLIAGIAMAHKEDKERLARGMAVFDDLYEYFRRKRS